MLANYRETLADANSHIDFLSASHDCAVEVGARLLETNERLNDELRLSRIAYQSLLYDYRALRDVDK